MRPPPLIVIVKATKGGTDTILYSQHATKIGSHNGQGKWTITKHHRHWDVWPRFWAQFVLEKQPVFDILFSHFHYQI